MKQLNVKKLVLLNLPYILLGLFATNLGEAWRLATGADASAKMLSFFSTLPVALFLGWMRPSVGGFLGYFGLFLAIYAVIWLSIWLSIRIRLSRINRSL